MEGAIFATTLSLASAVIVAVIGHMLAERRARGDHLANMRLNAYRDFLQATSRLVASRRLGRTEDELEELAILNDAKVRICVSGDELVVKALEEFWLAGGTLEGEREILSFTRLCMAMREGLGNQRNDITSPHLSDIIFRIEPSAFSFRADNAELRE